MGSQLPVTFITHEVHPYGGHERAGYELIRRLVKRGIPITVIARRCELAPCALLRSVRVPGPRRPFPLGYLWFLLLGTIATAVHGKGFRLSVGAITLNRVDAVAVHMCHNEYSRRPVAERRSRASPLHTTNAYISSALARLGERWCYRPSRARRLIAVSNGIAAELRRCFPRMATRITVVPNGVDRDRFRPDAEARARVRSEAGIEEDDLTAVFVGGDWNRKGLRIALAGVAATRRWHLLVAGDGDTAALHGLARDYGAADRLHLWGVTADPNEVYAAGDAFVLPSSYEAFSLATLEAAAAGLPLLVSRFGGVAEDLVVEGQTGAFIDRTPDSVRQALEALEADPAKRRRMGQAAPRAAEKYSWDEVARLYVSMIP